MKKVYNLLFYVFLIFLVINPIWSSSEMFDYIFIVSFIILDIIILFDLIKKKKLKIDKIDIILGLLPLFYILPLVFKRNVFDFSYNIHFILLEVALTFTVLILRRYLKKSHINQILIVILTSSTIFFFIAIIYQVFPRDMILFDIFSYFGDTYLNSIDRFYGTFNYCNTSALFFAISVFISLFMINDEKEEVYLFSFMFFVNLLGLVLTFSKMISLVFVFLLVVLSVFLILRKKYKLLNCILINIISSIFPILFMISSGRIFLINLNIWIFILKLLISFGCYLLINKCISFVVNLNKFIIIFVYIVILIVISYFTFNPINTSLKISNVTQKNDYIISDFILEENKEYEISVDIKSVIKSDVVLQLGRMYVEDLYPKYEIIDEIKEGEEYKFKFTTIDNEYYYLKVDNINENTNIVINGIKINSEDYLFNSLIVPYQLVHQLELTKYDKESVAHRFWYYRDSFEIIKDEKMIIGRGFNTFRYYTSINDYDYLENDPHSYLFQLWLDVGLYGPIYLILLSIVGIYNMWKNRKGNRVVIWFVIFSMCMIVVPFDCNFYYIFMKAILMLSFVMINDITKKSRS